MARLRKDVRGLGPGWSDTLLWYAKAVRALQDRPVTDRTSWWFLAAIHGFHPAVWTQFEVVPAGTPLPQRAEIERFWLQCQHQSWYFLPWHRAYLAAFEDIVRAAVVDAGGPADWALPYWNYSDATRPDARTLPEAFDEETLPDGSTNPLRVVRRFGSGVKPIEIDPDFVSLQALENGAFTGDVPPGFGGPETVFHHGPESVTTNGALESVPHNVVHGALGGVAPGGDPNNWRHFGLMSMPQSAALDPVFWLHHANIDRLWSVWLRGPDHANPRELTWLDGPVGRSFVMPTRDGGERVYHAREVLDTTAPLLDYSYEDETPPVVEERARRRPGRLAAAVSADRTPELVGASEAAVHVQGTTRAAVRLDAAAMRPRGPARAAAAAAGEDEPLRVFLKLEGIRGSSDAAIYRVYLDPPGADASASDTRPVGTISLFGVSAASSPEGPADGSGLNQVLEITESVGALRLSGDALERLEVRLVPANPAGDGATVSIERLSVFQVRG
ncbi:MAG: tyrosinase family protein [Vicinamibacteria bacterium]